MKALSEKEALRYAAAYCSGTERCIREVENKLSAAGITGETARKIIDRLIGEKFIDEARYAASFVNDKLRFNKWGRMRLDYELKKKDIPAAVRAEAIGNIDPVFYTDLLTTLLKEKKKSVKAKDPYDEYAKLFRFAAGRGFESPVVSGCLRKILRDSGYDPEE